MICVRTQMFTNNHRLLRNSPYWQQVKIRSADRGDHFRYIISLVYSKKCQIIAKRIEINIIIPVKRIFYFLFIDPT